MPQQKIEISQQFSRPVSQVFAQLADHQQLGGILMAPVARICDGKDELNGVGSVRRIGPPLIGVEETVLALQADKLIEYRISRNGGPVKNHHGRLEFSETPQGSQVDWTIVFDTTPAFLGKGLAKTLQTVISKGLKRIA